MCTRTTPTHLEGHCTRNPRLHPATRPRPSASRICPTLLRLFPTKPFYLTEYGYNTSYAVVMGIMVDQTRQADYLRRAYAYVARYRQVKLLCWFLVWDAAPLDGKPHEYGFYTGLRKTNGDRKLSWFAFAGGNRLTIDAPARARLGRVIRIGGKLTNSSVGALSGRRLVLQSRRLGSSSWRTLGGATTGRYGNYHIDVKPAGSRVYRIVWRGVKTSPSRTVLIS